MALLGHYNIKENVKFLFIFKLTTFIYLIWTYITYNNMDIFPKSLENKYEHGNILNRKLHRLLAKHELHRELGYAGKGGQLFHNSIDKNKKKVTEQTTISSHLNKTGSNSFDNYMKNYKRRYESKKGLSKLDCYYEKKVFDKINYIEKLSDMMRNDKKGFKKKIRKKYGIGFFILSLLPALGLIYYILFGCGKDLRGVFVLCMDNEHYEDKNSPHKDEITCSGLKRNDWDKTLGNIGFANEIFSYTMIIVVLLFFIYILAKVIKYEKLKAGKGKMRINEYYRFCKDIF